MKGADGIGTYEFIVDKNEDIVRNPIIAGILGRYSLKE